MVDIDAMIANINLMGGSEECTLYFHPVDKPIVDKIKKILPDIETIEAPTIKGTVYCLKKSVTDLPLMQYEDLPMQYEKPKIYDCNFGNVIIKYKGEDIMTDAERIKKAVELTSYILDTYTENTDEDRAYRNSARMFLQILTDEEIEIEE